MDGLLVVLGLVAVVLAAVALGVALLALRAADAPRTLGSGSRGQAAAHGPAAVPIGAGHRLTHQAATTGSVGEAAESQERSGAPQVSVGIGLVRFNAYDDTGGNQSFALALLDAVGDGVVLSSLHSRQSTRLYIKHVAGGLPDAPLSGEESRALEQAGIKRAPVG